MRCRVDQLLERSKLSHLPDDLRSIAEAMLREKFPEPKPETLYTTATESAEEGVLTLENLNKYLQVFQNDYYRRPAKLFVHPKQYREMMNLMADQIKFSAAPSMTCDWGTRIMGMDVAKSESISAGSMVFMDEEGRATMKVGNLDD